MITLVPSARSTGTRARLGLLAGVLLVLPPLAGCATETPDEPLIQPGPDTYELTLLDVPATVGDDEAFTFELRVGGPEGHASDHVGAHYGTQSGAEPSLAIYPSACDHSAGDLPGTFEVTCTIEDPGQYFLRGHVRVTTETQEVNYWSTEAVVLVEAPEDPDDGTPPDETPPTWPPFYELGAEGVPGNATVGEPISFNLTIDGTENGTSDHIGGHFGPNSTGSPSLAVYTGACQHQEGDFPATFTVTCTFEEAGTVYLRGHLRVTHPEDPAEQANFWTEEFTITVS